MRLKLISCRGDICFVDYPDFSSTMTEDQQFQQFLTHFKQSGFMINTDGEGVFFHAIESASIVRKQSVEKEGASDAPALAGAEPVSA